MAHRLHWVAAPAWVVTTLCAILARKSVVCGLPSENFRPEETAMPDMVANEGIFGACSLCYTTTHYFTKIDGLILRARVVLFLLLSEYRFSCFFLGLLACSSPEDWNLGQISHQIRDPFAPIFFFSAACWAGLGWAGLGWVSHQEPGSKHPNSWEWAELG